MKRAIFLSLILCTVTQGASEIQSFTNCTAAFAVVRELDGDVWYVSGQVFEAWGTSARTATHYNIALTAETGGMFTGTFDTNIGAGYYYVVTHDDADSTPADADPAVWVDYGYWTGSAWTSGPDAADIDAILADTGTTIPGTITTAQNDLNTITGGSGVLIDTDAVDADAIKADAVTEIQSGLATATNVSSAHTTTDALITSSHVTTDALINDVNDNLAASIGDVPTTEEIRIEMDSNSVDFNTIIEDTNELQTDWTNGGRLDLLIDAVKYKTDRITLVDTVVKDSVDANNFTIEDGTDVNDAYWFMAVQVEDADDNTSKEVRWINWYDENSGDPNLWVDEPFSFTPAVGDVVHVMGTTYGGFLYRIMRNLEQTKGVLNVIDQTKSGSGGLDRAGAIRIDALGDDP